MDRNRFFGNYIGTAFGASLAYACLNHNLKVAFLSFLSALIALFLSLPITIYLGFLSQSLPRVIIHIFVTIVCVFMITGTYSTLCERDPFHIVLILFVLTGAIFIGWFHWSFLSGKKS